MWPKDTGVYKTAETTYLAQQQDPLFSAPRAPALIHLSSPPPWSSKPVIVKLISPPSETRGITIYLKRINLIQRVEIDLFMAVAQAVKTEGRAAGQGGGSNGNKRQLILHPSPRHEHCKPTPKCTRLIRLPLQSVVRDGWLTKHSRSSWAIKMWSNT